jgi:RNA polymerase sigma-70 factor (ECF subfamily)
MSLPRRGSPGWHNDFPDEDLVGLAQRGDRAAFAVLYDRYVRDIYGYCYRSLGERESAQDASAETFRRALTGVTTCRPRSFRSWLFGIAHHVIIDDLRTRRPIVELTEALELQDSAASPEEIALATAAVDDLTRLLPLLTTDQRDAIGLRLAGLNPAEIGEALGKSRAAVDMTLHRALVRLQELMDVPHTSMKGGWRRG